MATEFARADKQTQVEGHIAKSIEEQTAKLPSDAFLWMAVGADVSDPGHLQQTGEAARVGPDGEHYLSC